MRHGISTIVLATSLASGCAVHGVHVAGLDVPTPAPIVEQVDTPLYVVVEGIPETPVAGDRGPALHQLRHFARRPLQDSLSTYFDTVIVVDSAAHLPQTPHLVLVIGVDDVGTRSLELKPWDRMLARSVPTMTWGAYLEGTGVDAPAFEHVVTIEGDQPMSALTSAEPAVTSLLGAALTDLTTHLVHSGTIAALRAEPQPEPELPPVPACDDTAQDAVSVAP